MEEAGRRKAQHPANHSRSCARPSQYDCRRLPPSGQAAGAADTLSGQPRVHRAGSGPAQVLPTGPVVLRIGIHHVAPSLALPVSLLPLPPSSNTILHTRPEEAFWFFGASWRAGSGRRCWTGSRLNIVTKKADTQPVLATDRVFPSPSSSSCEYTEAFFLLPALPCLFGLPGYYLVLDSPLPVYRQRAPILRPRPANTRRSPSISPATLLELPARMSTVVSSAPELPNLPRTPPKGCHEKPRIATSIMFDHGSLPSKPRYQEYGTTTTGSQC